MSQDVSTLSKKDLFPPLLLCAFLLGACLLTGFFQEEPDSDETVYLAMAEAWAREGRIPYRDFFHAHPPGLLAPATLLYRIAPPSILLGRIVPVLSTAVLFLLLLVCAGRLEKDSRLPGLTIFAGTLFLVSPLVHLVGAVYLGLNTSAALCLAAVALSLSGRPGASGFALGLSLTVRLGTLPVAIVFAVLHRKKPLFLLGALIGLLPLLLCFLFWPGCFDQVVLFHLRKKAMLLGARFEVLGGFLYEEKFLLLFAVPALLSLRVKALRPFLAAGFLCLAFACLQKVVWPYYFHLAILFLCIPSAAWIAKILRPKIKGRSLILANLALLLVAGLLNLIVISPRYRHDETLLPLVEKAREIAGPTGNVLDLSGGGKGCYLAARTGLSVAGGLFDMSLHRYDDGSLSGERLAAEIRLGPDLVLTEMQAEGKTILWSRLPRVRRALLGAGDLGGFRPVDYLLRANDLSLIVLWAPLEPGEPSLPTEVQAPKPRPWRFRYITSGPVRKSRVVETRGDFGMGSPEVFEEALRLPEGPGLLVARGAFTPPDAVQLRWRAEDRRGSRPISSFVWVHPRGGRLLIETVYSDVPYSPLSFTDARFDRERGTLSSMRVYGEVGRGFVPVLSIRPALVR